MMHLEGPWLSTTGKKKGKQKFRNTDAARKTRELKDDWEDLKTKHNIQHVIKKREPMKTLSYNLAYRGQNDKPKSCGDGIGVATAKEQKVYTGTECIGIGQLHKSNAVPVFKQEDAKDIARMRR